MLNAVNPQDRLAVGRLLELLSKRAPWHRSLWGVGVLLAMDELFEACTAMREGHLSEGSLKRMTSSLQRRIGTHPAFSDQERRFFSQQVNSVPRAESPAHFAIRQLSSTVAEAYLSRWADSIAGARFTVERFAREVASHLLDAGFSQEHLHGFIKDNLSSEVEITLPELCEALQTMVGQSPRREFEVLVALNAVPALSGGVPATWLQGPSVTDWLKEQNFETRNVRSPVAFLLKVQARDLGGAAEAAKGEAERYAARTLIATGKPLNLVPTLWVKGDTRSVPMEAESRGVSVKELARDGKIYSTQIDQNIDAALELLAHLEGSSPAAAIAGGWAAIEGLLAVPNDRASAADNLAALITCSFPRAELTSLSYHVQRTKPEAFPELADAPTNRERCRTLAQIILDDRMPVMESTTHQAAVDRAKKLLADPRKKLLFILDEVGDSLHRLYRQRNLILHGGRLNSVSLAASLRTVSKLVGAGMDRIIHGHYAQGIKPLDLVAKAHLSIALATPGSAIKCVDLLEDS